MTSQQNAVRHFACSLKGSIIAAAELERSVQIWDLAEGQQISAFDTILDSGGLRLAIAPDGKACVAGSHKGEGVAAYDTSTGEELWRRVDLKKPQKIRMSIDGTRVFCGFDEIPFEVLDLATGSSLPSFRAVKDLWESPYDGCLALIRKGENYDIVSSDGQSLMKLRRKSFAALGFAFAPRILCVSESVGLITGYSLQDGEELWTFQPERDVHALSLAYEEVQGCFFAVTWTYTRRGNQKLIRLDPSTGTSTPIAEFAPQEHHFCLGGTELILADGRRLPTMSAEDVRRNEKYPIESMPPETIPLEMTTESLS